MVSGCCHGIRLLPWYQGGGYHHTLQEVVDSVSYSTGSCNLLVLFIVIATHLVVKVGRCPLVASQTQVYQSWLEKGGGGEGGEGRTNARAQIPYSKVGHWELAGRSIQAEALLDP